MGSDDSGDRLTLSEAVLQEVAEHKGVPPEDLDPPLYAVVDPDALDVVFRGATGHVSFVYHGYVVTVDHSGNVSLEPTAAE